MIPRIRIRLLALDRSPNRDDTRDMTTHNTHTPKFEPGNKFEAGRQCAFREMDAERWDVEMAIEYLAEIGEPISEFDAGYIAGVREFAGFTEGQ